MGLPRSESITVPSVWNTKLGLLEYKGAAWYQKKFYSEGGRIKLHFGAVMTQADLWLDVVRLEGHYGGFCEFDRFCTATKGYHTLTVRADNRFNEYSVPQKSVDWYHYGGITRDVYYERLAEIVVLGNHFEYTLSNDLSQADCSFKIKLYNAERKKITTRLNVLLGDECVFSGDVTLATEEHLIFTAPRFTVNNVRLWNVVAP